MVVLPMNRAEEMHQFGVVEGLQEIHSGLAGYGLRGSSSTMRCPNPVQMLSHYSHIHSRICMHETWLTGHGHLRVLTVLPDWMRRMYATPHLLFSGTLTTHNWI